MSAIVIWQANADSLDIVDRLMRESFDPRYGEAWTRSQCAGVLALPGVWLLLASIDTRPVGFALARTIVDEAELLLLATHPDARRQGVGSALIANVVARSIASSLQAVHLEVRDGNQATALYAAHGFEQVGQRHHYYKGPGGTRFDALTFRLSPG